MFVYAKPLSVTVNLEVLDCLYDHETGPSLFPTINKLGRSPATTVINSPCISPSQLSVLHLPLERFTTRSESRYWLRIAISTYPTCTRQPEFPSEYRHDVWYGKKLYPMVKFFWRYRMYERDRQTDGRTGTQSHTARWHKRACLASCGKNRLGLGYLCVLNQLLLFSCTTLREINHFEWKFNTDNRPITEEMLIWRIYASFAFGHSSLQTVGLYLNGWWVHYTHAAAEASLTTEWIQNKLGTIWKTSGSESRLMQKFWLKARITFAGRGKG